VLTTNVLYESNPAIQVRRVVGEQRTSYRTTPTTANGDFQKLIFDVVSMTKELSMPDFSNYKKA
jgi:hypothetical protein